MSDIRNNLVLGRKPIIDCSSPGNSAQRQTCLPLRKLSEWVGSGLIFLFALMPIAAWAACPPPPKDFSLPPPQRSQVDLVRELAQPWQAGGEIVVSCRADSWPQAGRRATPPRDRKEEMVRRREAWALVRMFNLTRKPGEVKARSLPVTPAQEALLERFALSDAGAVWMRELVDDTLRLFNRGDLEARRKVWSQALKTGRMPKLTALLTGRLSEGGQFSQSAPLFKIYAYPGEGAQAEPGLVGLGDAGFRCEFPASGQMVDPHAILSHEFGHTRYGDPASAGSLLGEATTVERYENPVRVRNGFEPRTVYYLRQPTGGLKEQKSGLLGRLIHLQTVEGISVEDRRAIEQIHCECPAPLPVVLNCEERQRANREVIGPESIAPATEMDCKVEWKPDAEPVAKGATAPVR
jgi:hypothetical protein